MAINPLTGTDTSFGLYGTPQQAMPMQARQYPAWMTNAQARGIGVAQQFNAPRIAPIDIPRGDGMGGFNNQMVAPPLQPMQDFGGGQPAYVSEGGGFGSDGSAGLGTSATANAPAGGFLSDLVNMLGLNVGDYGPEGAFGGGMQDGLGMTGNEQMGQDTNAVAGNENASAGPSAELADAGFSHGGHVTRNRLHGPDPRGPDDGYAALNVGEGIITAEAMKHYGKGILSKLNKLQVPKGAFGKK